MLRGFVDHPALHAAEECEPGLCEEDVEDGDDDLVAALEWADEKQNDDADGAEEERADKHEDGNDDQAFVALDEREAGCEDVPCVAYAVSHHGRVEPWAF